MGRWSTSGPVGSGFGDMVFNPARPATAYMGNWGGVFKTLDGGRTWTPMTAGMNPSLHVNGLALAASAPRVLYAATEYGGVFKTIDGGLSWSRVLRPVNQYGAVVDTNSVAADPRNPDVAYAGTGGGDYAVYVTRDGGASWMKRLHGGGAPWSLVVNPVNPAVVYLG